MKIEIDTDAGTCEMVHSDGTKRAVPFFKIYLDVGAFSWSHKYWPRTRVIRKKALDLFRRDGERPNLTKLES